MTKTRFAFPFLSLMFIALVCLAFSSISSFDLQSNAQEKSTKMLRHVVMFKFKDTSSKEDIQKIVEAFRTLKKSISQVAAFEHGTNNSPEGLANGFTHCFLLTFKSEADRGGYLDHPKHKEFVDILMPHLDKAQVLDYWAIE